MTKSSIDDFQPDWHNPSYGDFAPKHSNSYHRENIFHAAIRQFPAPPANSTREPVVPITGTHAFARRLPGRARRVRRRSRRGLLWQAGVCTGDRIETTAGTLAR